MKFGKVIAIVCVGALAISAVAQGGGGGRGQGGGGGRGGFGQGGRMMMGGMQGGVMPAAFLLQRDDVQADLKLTSEQKDKLDAIRQKSMERMREVFTGGGAGAGAGAGGGGGRGGGFQLSDEQRKQMEKMTEETTKEVNAVLTPDQSKRLRQIGVQLAGSRAVTSADVAKELGLSEDQSKKIADLMTKQREANQAIGEKMRNGDLDREGAQAAREKNNKILDDEINKVLTDAQKTKLKEMAGPEFKRDDN